MTARPCDHWQTDGQHDRPTRSATGSTVNQSQGEDGQQGSGHQDLDPQNDGARRSCTPRAAHRSRRGYGSIQLRLRSTARSQPRVSD